MLVAAASQQRGLNREWNQHSYNLNDDGDINQRQLDAGRAD